MKDIIDLQLMKNSFLENQTHNIMNCYIANIKDGSVYPPELNKENTLFYPEQNMTTLECFETGRPSEFHIVTDSIFLVPLFDRDEVFIWKKNKWVNPDFQTYGCSYTRIMDLFGITSSIPRATLDGKTTNVMGHPKK
jgi:hypothetical protein